MRDELGEYLGENIPGRGNSKQVTWLGPQSEGRRGSMGQLCLLFRDYRPSARSQAFLLSEMEAKTGLSSHTSSDSWLNALIPAGC